MSDLRHALRMLRRTPGFTAAAIVILAVGIGANAAIFSVVRGVLIRPLPYPESDRLVAVWESNPGPGWSERNPVTDGNYLDWRDRNTTFAALGAYGMGFGVAALGDDIPAEVTAVRVTPSVFQVLGVGAGRGRTFAPEDGQPDGDPVAILSYGMWRDRFGADPGIVGRTVHFDEQPFTVIGVMPASFGFPSPATDVWLPLRLGEADRQSRTSHKWRVIGRLERGVRVERAQADMDAIAARLREEHPAHMDGWSITVAPYHSDLVRNARPLLLTLLGLVNVLLLIACANVANLSLTRTVRREHELSVRRALGGSRRRIAGELLAEAGLLALLGVSGGIALGAWGVVLLRAVAPPDIPFLDQVRVDVGVLAYVAGVAVLVTLLIGLLPALRAGRAEPGAALRGGRTATGGARRGQLRSALLVGELALSMVLLAGAGLLARSFLQLQAVDHGFEPDRLLAVGLYLPHTRYGGTPAHHAFYARVVQELAALPGVEAVTGTTEPPVIGFDNTFSFVIEGRVAPPPRGREQPVQVRVVTPGYFETMGIPLLEGRGFTTFDRVDGPTVVAVNHTLARRFWPGESPVGKRIAFDGHDGPWLEVVGVVGDTRHTGLDRPVEPAMYMPLAQKRWGWMSWMTLFVRTSGDPLEAAPAVRRTIWALDDRLPIRDLAPMTDIYAASNERRRFAALLTVGFPVLAVCLGLFGVFGVVSYSVAQRQRELGLRLALGAEARRIVVGVLRHGMKVAGLGVALGGLAALALSRLIRHLLFGVTATDPPTFSLTALLLIGIALLASWIPARRAARIDPMEVLRHE